MEAITLNSTLLYKGLSSYDITSPLVTAPCFIKEDKTNTSSQERKPDSKAKCLYLEVFL